MQPGGSHPAKQAGTHASSSERRHTPPIASVLLFCLAVVAAVALSWGDVTGGMVHNVAFVALVPQALDGDGNAVTRTEAASGECLAALDQLYTTRSTSPARIMALVRAYGSLGRADRVVELWSGIAGDADWLAAYWAGRAFEQLQEPARALGVWGAFGVQSQAALRLRQKARQEGNEARLLALAEIATALVPHLGNSYPYREVLDAASDYDDWGMKEAAASLYMLVAASTPTSDIRYWYAASSASRSRGDVDEFDALFRQAEAQWPHTETLYLRHVRALLVNNEWARATAAARAWTAALPKSANGARYTGEAHLRAGDLDEARLWLERALALAPSSTLLGQCQKLLGDVARKKGEFSSARSHYQAALDAGSNDASTWFALAETHHTLGEAKLAIDAAGQAIENVSPATCPATWYALLGEWHRELGQREQAVQAYKQALLCAPGNLDVQTALHELQSE